MLCMQMCTLLDVLCKLLMHITSGPFLMEVYSTGSMHMSPVVSVNCLKTIFAQGELYR